MRAIIRTTFTILRHIYILEKRCKIVQFHRTVTAFSYQWFACAAAESARGLYYFDANIIMIVLIGNVCIARAGVSGYQTALKTNSSSQQMIIEKQCIPKVALYLSKHCDLVCDCLLLTEVVWYFKFRTEIDFNFTSELSFKDAWIKFPEITVCSHFDILLHDSHVFFFIKGATHIC